MNYKMHKVYYCIHNFSKY